MAGFKAKTIKKVLNKKIEDWLSTIDDEVVKLAIMSDVIVTGGSIASMLLGEKINDFDVYFRTTKTAELVAEYYINQSTDSCVIEVDEDLNRVRLIFEGGTLGNNPISQIELDDDGTVSEYDENAETDDVEEDESLPRYRPIFFSENAITLSHKIQLVMRFTGSPDEIHGNYDFVHAMNYYDYKEQHLELRPEALQALLSKTLIYRGSLYPICSLFRLRKFISRGWKVTAGEILKISWQVYELDLRDPNVLRDQLTGVDMLYFNSIIKKIEQDGIEKLDSSYISTIVDRVFN